MLHDVPDNGLMVSVHGRVAMDDIAIRFAAPLEGLLGKLGQVVRSDRDVRNDTGRRRADRLSRDLLQTELSLLTSLQ